MEVLDIQNRHSADSSLYAFFDAEETPEQPDLFKYPVKTWRKAIIGHIIRRTLYQKGSLKTGRAKDAELAFYILNHVRGVSANTLCRIGLCWKGRAIRIGNTEYRQRDGLLYEKKI